MQKSNIKIKFIVEPNDSGFCGWTPDVDGIFVEGDTKEETRKMLQEAISLHLEKFLRNDLLPANRLRTSQSRISDLHACDEVTLSVQVLDGVEYELDDDADMRESAENNTAKPVYNDSTKTHCARDAETKRTVHHQSYRPPENISPRIPDPSRILAPFRLFFY